LLNFENTIGGDEPVFDNFVATHPLAAHDRQTWRERSFHALLIVAPEGEFAVAHLMPWSLDPTEINHILYAEERTAARLQHPSQLIEALLERRHELEHR